MSRTPLQRPRGRTRIASVDMGHSAAIHGYTTANTKHGVEYVKHSTWNMVEVVYNTLCNMYSNLLPLHLCVSIPTSTHSPPLPPSPFPHCAQSAPSSLFILCVQL